MPVYVEAVEIDESETGVDAFLVQLDLAGISQANAITQIKLDPATAGKHYMIRRHACNHAIARECVSVDLEEVGG